jgi:hypothetical protein
MSDMPDRLPSQIINHITSIRNYLKHHNLKSIQIEDDKLTIVDLNETVRYNPDGFIEYGDNYTICNNNDNSVNGCSIEIILPVYNDTQLRAVKDILASAKNIIEIMIDDDLTELISHPVSNIDDDIRCEIEKMFNSCQSPSSKRVGNECRFIAGYYASLDEGGIHWTRNMSSFQRGCKIYYELIRLVVANIVGVGEYEEEWKRRIKKDIFYVNIKPAYLKDINRKNWVAIKQNIVNYCHYHLQPQQRQRQQQISRQQRQFVNLFLRFHGFL